MDMKGKGISDGYAIGRLTVYSRKIVPRDVSTVLAGRSEISRFNYACKIVGRQLAESFLDAEDNGNDTLVNLLRSYTMMLEDPEYSDAIRAEIKKSQCSAESALLSVRDRLCDSFSIMNDAYLQARCEDIRDLSSRILTVLNGGLAITANISDECILLADSLNPSDVMELGRGRLLGFATRRGSGLSHTAILARSLGIPAMVGVDFPLDADGKMAILDAVTGELIIDPDEETLTKYRKKQADRNRRMEELLKLISLPSETSEGKHIGLFANVGSLIEVEQAIKNGCEAIGLMRSEFLYLDDVDYPSEEKQYEIFSRAVQMLEGRELTIRTIDIGGDKQVPYMEMKHEDNPAMGMRAIRYCLGHKDVFRTQLRAILRAAFHGPVSILLPMIISIEEVWQIKSLIYEVQTELDRQGIKYGKYRLGIMIETPAACIISDLLAKEVDFFSIGTNDLTQYTLAVDRQNTELEFICDYHHQAVLRMLKMIVNNGHAYGCKVCVCGELAADTSFTEELLRMGVDELSVTPAMLLRVKQAIRDARLS